MKLEYDPEVDAAYVRLRSATVAKTDEIAPGVMMDLAADGRPVGFEILDASEVLDGRPAGCDVRAGQPGARLKAVTRDR